MRSTWRVYLFLVMLTCLLSGGHQPALAQRAQSVSSTGPTAPGTDPASAERGNDCRDDITESAGYKFRSVRVRARYLPDLQSKLPSPGTVYSPATVTKIVEDVYQLLKAEANREDEEGETEHKLLSTVTIGKGRLEEQSRSGQAIGFKLVTSCTKVVKQSECSQCVDVTIHAISVRIDTANPIANLLNLPRSNRPSFLSKVPGPLLALNPKLRFDNDREWGPAASFAMSTNLLDLSRNLRSEPLHARRTRLDLQAIVAKSLTNNFYTSDATLSISRSLSGKVNQIALDASFSGEHSALGQNEYLRNALRFGGNIKMRSPFEPFEDISLKGRYRWSNNKFISRTLLPSQSASENSFDLTGLLDGRVWQGVSRLGFWFEGNSPGNGNFSYRRGAVLWAYQKEFLVVHNQSVGIEALLGVGRAWGAVPEYARFYGGNSTKNFLYESKDSPSVTSFPSGPLLRSFGSGQATSGSALRPGGTSYWNLNIGVSIPVPQWSSPLVPDISIELPKKDENGNVVMNGDNPVMEDRPLRIILKNQGESSRRVVERILIKEGLSPAEAAVKARREMKAINSILGFIADQANIYSFKPLVMFDAARLDTRGVTGQTRFAFGGGLQFTVVIAKFEAGYMRTLRGQPGDSKGNFVMRLFFQNLF